MLQWTPLAPSKIVELGLPLDSGKKGGDQQKEKERKGKKKKKKDRIFFDLGLLKMLSYITASSLL